jgi:hypothetical protein
MRVEIVEKLPEHSWVSEKKVNDAPENRALQTFISSLSSEDSHFLMEHPGSGAFHAAGQAGEIYSGDFLITFRSLEDQKNTSLHFTLLEKLSELFHSAGSSDTLGVILSLRKAPSKEAENKGLVLRLRLEATGDSAEQAELRWGLGLAHIQQGLLFASRWLRQRSSSRAN